MGSLPDLGTTREGSPHLYLSGDLMARLWALCLACNHHFK